MNKFNELYEKLLPEAKGSKNWKAVLKSNPYVWIIFDPTPTQGSTGILVKKVGKDLSWKQLGSKYQGLTDTWNSGKAWELERDLKGQKYYVLDKHPDELNEAKIDWSTFKDKWINQDLINDTLNSIENYKEFLNQEGYGKEAKNKITALALGEIVTLKKKPSYPKSYNNGLEKKISDNFSKLWSILSLGKDNKTDFSWKGKTDNQIAQFFKYLIKQ